MKKSHRHRTSLELPQSTRNSARGCHGKSSDDGGTDCAHDFGLMWLVLAVDFLEEVAELRDSMGERRRSSSRERGLRGPDLHQEYMLEAVSVWDTDVRRGACELS